MDDVGRMFQRRGKIIRHNNYAILETLIFYENFLLYQIITPYFFNNNFKKSKQFEKFILDRMNIMDKYKLVKEIANEYKIDITLSQKKFEKFIQFRNDIAHNHSNVGLYNVNTKENLVYIGGKEITWERYLVDLKEWSDISLEMANLILEIYDKVDITNKLGLVGIIYCEIFGNCALMPHNRLFPSPEEDYKSPAGNGIGGDLYQFIVEENKQSNTTIAVQECEKFISIPSNIVVKKHHNYLES